MTISTKKVSTNVPHFLNGLVYALRSSQGVLLPL